jgi:hypothetical protein
VLTVESEPNRIEYLQKSFTDTASDWISDLFTPGFTFERNDEMTKTKASLIFALGACCSESCSLVQNRTEVFLMMPPTVSGSQNLGDEK